MHFFFDTEFNCVFHEASALKYVECKEQIIEMFLLVCNENTSTVC